MDERADGYTAHAKRSNLASPACMIWLVLLL